MALSKIKSDSIDSIAATKLTGTVDNARITLDAAEIPNLDAAKITTGSIANARVPAAAVTQHVAAADLTPAHQGIANLGLIMATEHDKVAFNLTGSFIDIFQDDSGITTETDVDRNASEYVSPNVSGIAAYVTTNRGSTTPTVTVTSYGITTANGSVGLLVNGVASGSASNAWNWNNQTPSAGAYVQFAYSTAMIVTEANGIKILLIPTERGNGRVQILLEAHLGM